MAKRQVILFTDGDHIAQQTVEEVARRVGGRCISQSAGNPTRLSGEEIVDLILSAKHDPVLVMFDDCGSQNEGLGEQALRYVATHHEIEVLGAVAVASNSRSKHGTPVQMALDWKGNIISDSVGKDGDAQKEKNLYIYGDTVEVLNKLQIPIIIGIGDLGKMRDQDSVKIGAPVTTKAVKLILEITEKNKKRK